MRKNKKKRKREVLGDSPALEEGEPPPKKRKIVKNDTEFDEFMADLSTKPLFPDLPISSKMNYTIQELNKMFDGIKNINIVNTLKSCGFKWNETNKDIENLHFSLKDYTTGEEDLEKHYLLPNTPKLKKWLDEKNLDWNKQLVVKNLANMYGQNDPAHQNYTLNEIMMSLTTVHKHHLKGVPKLSNTSLRCRTISIMLLDNFIRKKEGKLPKYQFFVRNENFTNDPDDEEFEEIENFNETFL